MENNLAKFENDVFGDLNTVVINEEIWLNANDVCRALGYKNPRKALEDHVDGEDVTKRYTLTEGGNQQMNYINESGFYSLVFGSKLPGAKDFKKWVTSEVLPSIRKQGYYVDKERMEYLEKVNEQYQQMTNSSGLFSVTTIAKAYGLSGVRLNQLLNDWKIQYKQNNTWTLYTDYSDKGYTAIRTHTHLNHDDECWYTTALTYWTNKGKMFIDEQMKQHGYCMV